MNEARRVLRGGSWDISHRSLRCTFRLNGIPAYRYGYREPVEIVNSCIRVRGFRVVVNGTREESGKKILRGGSFCNNRVNARCTYRYRNASDPGYRFNLDGFRVVVNGVAHRVSKGGLFGTNTCYPHSASRSHYIPSSCSCYNGFRVVVNMKRRRVRGGSWAFDRRLARCAFPGWVDPVSLLRDRGVRVVVNRVEREISNRVVRGGSFTIGHGGVRCTYCYWFDPVYLYGYLGFRPVLYKLREKDR